MDAVFPHEAERVTLHSWQAVLTPLLVFCWPFLFCLPLVTLLGGQFTAIGNDFDVLYYVYKHYLLDTLASGRLPLWSPAEGAGFPFYASPFTQTFYPLNLPLVLFYQLNSGYSRLNHQVYTVLGVAIFALGLYFWLRDLRLNPRAVLFAALLMPVSFKMMEILRFPNAVHTAAWYPWVLFALTRILRARSMRTATLFGALLVFCGVCFLTAGYPYYNYYGIFLFGPYILFFLVRPLRLKLFGDTSLRFKLAIPTLLIAGAIVLLLCGPYLIKMLELMNNTVDRSGNNWAYATAHIFNLEDTVGSLIYPPLAQAEGWYYFSIMGVLLVALYLRGRPRDFAASAWYLSPWVKVILFAWLGIIIYITFGRESFLFKALWGTLPGFSSLRVWGRLNIILVPILALVLAIAYTHFESLVTSRAEARTNMLLILVPVYLVVLILQLYLYVNRFHDGYWEAYFSNPHGLEPSFLIWGGIAFTFVAIALRSPDRDANTLRTILLGSLLIALIDVRGGQADNWMWITGRWSWTGPARVNVESQNLGSFDVKRQDNYNTLTLTPQFSVGILENWYFQRYINFLNSTKNELGARRVLLGVSSPQKIFFSEAIRHPTIGEFLEDRAHYEDTFTYKVIAYTGDDLILEVQAPVDGFLSFIDNWDKGWTATVDGQPVPIDLLFGTFKSLRLSAGQHRVTFSYRPGMW